jgi:DNA-nicking Smr family endonuclease
VRPLPGRAAPEPEAEPLVAPPGPPLAKAPSAAKPGAPPARARRSPPADRGGERRVGRGQVEIAASIDLHGYTQDRAQAALTGFLLRAQSDGARTVIVVTGKGRGGEEGVLKRRLPAWLDGPDLRFCVAGYAQAHRRHGGAGAYYVFVKRRPD